MRGCGVAVGSGEGVAVAVGSAVGPAGVAVGSGVPPRPRSAETSATTTFVPAGKPS